MPKEVSIRHELSNSHPGITAMGCDHRVSQVDLARRQISRSIDVQTQLIGRWHGGSPF
jgi:hypothetical protein